MSNVIKANTTKYEDFILPCPFCGETEEIYLEEYEHGAGTRWRIVCCSCMAQIDRGIDQHQGRLCKLWNTRAV
jgi:hypothetical protein